MQSERRLKNRNLDRLHIHERTFHAGATLVADWPFTSFPLATHRISHRLSTGFRVVPYGVCTGFTLVPHKVRTISTLFQNGSTLGSHWVHTRFNLLPHWVCTGFNSTHTTFKFDLHWFRTDSTLVSHWIHIGYTLVHHWVLTLHKTNYRKSCDQTKKLH